MALHLEPMTQAEYDVWRVDAVRIYAREFVDAGILDEQTAFVRAQDDFAQLLPDGRETADHLLWNAHVDTEPEPVGAIWVALVPDRTPLHSYVYALDVHPPYRRRGYGEQIMQAAISACRDRGVGSMGLNVFGHNDVARRLYDRLGFVVTSTSMKLTL